MNIASFAYEVGMSTADSLTAALSFGKFGILSMGMDAAGTQANNILARGGSREQALLGGLASGVVEAATEFFSVDKLLQNANSLDAADTFFKALGKQVFTEGTEEMSSEILNILVDAANMGNLSENSQAVKSYMEQGLSYDEARTRVLYDNIARVIESGVAGSISGGISIGITGAGKRIGANAQGEENAQQERKPLTEQAEQTQNQEAQTEKKEATRSAGDGATTDVNPTDHTEEEQQTMREYENAADEELHKTQSAKEDSAPAASDREANAEASATKRDENYSLRDTMSEGERYEEQKDKTDHTVPAASDRELLSDVSASAAVENGQERKHLRGYREVVERLKKAKQKRDAIAAALETVEPDSAGAASLRASLRQLEETIARHESRLAKLESSKPLQALLKRLRSSGEQIQHDGEKKSVANTSNDDIIKSRGLAMGLRKPASHVLTPEEIDRVREDARALNIPEELLAFNTGRRTSFLDGKGIICICGDILPDPFSNIARDRMSQRAVLAHEYYGHFLHHPSEYVSGDWRDEFRASYEAAKNAPNLSAEDRALLMIDAYDRAHEAGIPKEYDKLAKELIYGY